MHASSWHAPACMGRRHPEVLWLPSWRLHSRPDCQHLPAMSLVSGAIFQPSDGAQGYAAIKEQFSTAVAAQNAALLRARAGAAPPPTGDGQRCRS